MPNVVLPRAPLATNRGRVVLDTVGSPMRVTAKFDPSFTPPGGATERGVSGELCVTPCVVDLPVGKYRLFFSPLENSNSALGDSDDLIVDEGITVYRRAPGLYRTPSPTDGIGPIAVMLAGALAITAGALTHKDDATLGTGLLIGGGVAIVGGGIWGYDKSRATQQDGATSVWQLSGPAPSAPASPATLAQPPASSTP